MRASTALHRLVGLRGPGTASSAPANRFHGVRRSPSAGTKQHHPDGLDQNQQIEQKRMVLDVIKIVFELLDRLFEIAAVGVAYLCPTGQSWLDAMPDGIERDLLAERANKCRAFRPWPHKAHLPAQDVDELRKFVDARVAHESPHGRNARVVDACPRWLPILFGVLGHAPKLEQCEFMAVTTDSLLPVDDRGATTERDEQCYNNHDWQSDRQHYCRDDDVETALHEIAQPGLTKPVPVDEPACLERLDR